MSTTLLIARCALAAVFALAAAGKLANRPGSRRALEDFGVPATLARPGAVVLPLTELAIAACLIVVNTAAWAAAAATVMLAVFCAAITRALGRGETPDCHCFGSVESGPAGRRTLARNAVLIAVAGFVAIAGWHDPGGSVTVLADGLGVATIVLGLAIAVQAAFSWQLFHQHGRLLARLATLEAGISVATDDDDDGRPLAVGELAPDFVLPDLQGRERSLGELLGNGRGVLLVFTDPDCAHCEPLLPALGGVRSDREPQVVVISRGDHADNAARAQEHDIAPLLLQRDFEVAEAYRVFGSPAAILMDTDGRILRPAAVGQRAVAELLHPASTLRPPLVRTAPEAGALVEVWQA